MNTSNWLKQSQEHLQVANVTTARLDCLVLLEDGTGKDRAWLLSHPEYELQIEIVSLLNTKIAQRAQHMPLAYIRGHAEFYGRDFTVNEHVLVPRPETEAMIEMLKRVRNLEADMHTMPGEPFKRRTKIKKPYPFEKTAPISSLVKTDTGYKMTWQKPPRPARASEQTEITRQNTLSYHDETFHLIDVGTGSGALAISAKLEMPDATVTAIDIDDTCLDVARANAKALQADVEFLQGNLLEPLRTMNDDMCPVLFCNLPYVPTDYIINQAASHEPKLALYGGEDGLDLYRTLFNQIVSYEWRPAYILTESLPEQHIALAAMAETAGYELTRTDGFIQLFEPTE